MQRNVIQLEIYIRPLLNTTDTFIYFVISLSETEVFYD